MKNETELLNEKIISLENRRVHELTLLKEHLYHMHEELKPVNFIKNTLKEITASPEIKNTLLDNAMGLITGFISKKIIVGSTHNPIKNLLGNILQFAVANMVSKHSDTIKTAGGSLLERIIKYAGQLKHKG
ncbi:MAG TPA: hypothetical protein VKG26_16145 [Bacteroidia bacterium]|nr:hypothetical protein [Bacteroidia bacterium]